MARTFAAVPGATFIRVNVVTVVPDTTSTHNVDIPPGFYRIAAFVRADITGTTTSIALHLFTDQNQTAICTAPVSVYEINDSSAMTDGLALIEGGGNPTEQVFTFYESASLGGPAGVPILNGCQVAVDDGAGLENEMLEVTLVFQRV